MRRALRKSALLGAFIALAVASGGTAAEDGLLSDLEILSNIRGEARIDRTTDAWWSEDMLAPRRPVTDTARRLDRGQARLADPYLILYARLNDPALPASLDPVLTLADSRPDVRLFFKPLPQDGAESNLALCVEHLIRVDPGEARTLLAFLSSSLAVDGYLDFAAMFERFGGRLATLGSAEPCDHAIGERTIAQDMDEAYDFGLELGPAYVINGYRVTGPQTAQALEALLRWSAVRTRGEITERGPLPPDAAEAAAADSGTESAPVDPYTDCILNAGGVTGREIECGLEAVARRDAALNAVWKRVYPALQAYNAESAAALLEEQRAWIRWKETACTVYVADLAFGLDGQRTHHPLCLIAMIDQRIGELENIGALVGAETR
jgi:uncharacterized protein YecT (DUF1311 family)